MARQLRLDFEGALHHVFNRGNNRQTIFRSDPDRKLFLKLLGECALRFGWLVHVYTLMTNHFHIVIETPLGDLSRGMKELQGKYATYFNKKHRRTGSLFEGRFKSQLVEKESYLLELARYTVLNPVRAKMVERPEDYRWSSYRAMVGLEAAPEWLTTSWLLQHFGVTLDQQRAEYRKFVDAGVGLKRSPWDDLRHQIYLGTEAWVEKMRALVEAEERSEEHPKTQRFIARPTVEKVIATVAEVLEVPIEEITEQHGAFGRTLVAHLAFHEGLIRLRAIARSLTLRSSGHISNLVRRCKERIRQQSDVADVIAECLSRLRPVSLALN